MKTIFALIIYDNLQTIISQSKLTKQTRDFYFKV